MIRPLTGREVLQPIGAGQGAHDLLTSSLLVPFAAPRPGRAVCPSPSPSVASASGKGHPGFSHARPHAGSTEAPPAVARWEAAFLFVILAVTSAVLVVLAWRTGVTVDEPSHLVSSYLYWDGRDTLKPADMPPLIKIVGGWVPHLVGLPLHPRDHPVWRTGHEWAVSSELMLRLPREQVDRLFFWSRLPFLVFPLLCLFLAWRWGRQLFSPLTGIALTALMAMSPTLLGHGSLFKNDVACSLAYLWFIYRGWRYWKDPSPTRAMHLGAATLLGILAKFSLLVLVPLLVLILGARNLRGNTFKPLLVHVFMALAVVYLGIVIAFPGRLSVLSLPEATEFSLLRRPDPAYVALRALMEAVPFPERFRTGLLAIAQSMSDGAGVYLLGKVYSTGHPLYFLVALAVKVPAALQLLVATALLLTISGVTRRQSTALDCAWLLGGAVFYIAAASASSLQLGIRLILPGILCLLVLCGISIERCTRTAGGRAGLAGAFLWLAGTVVYHYPNYISFFNLWVDGPERGMKYLSDSNIDWGQDMEELGKFVRERKIPRIHVAYFGFDAPFLHIPENRLELSPSPWDPEGAKIEKLTPERGYWAVSVSLLTGQHFDERHRDYFAAFRKAKPIGHAGNSIFVYHFD